VFGPKLLNLLFFVALDCPYSSEWENHLETRAIMAKISITICKAVESDFEKWALMREALWPEANAASHLKELPKFFEDKYTQAWMAIDGQKYIGFAEVSVRRFANGCESEPVPFLEGIWVDEPYRRQHVGQRFIETIEAWARSRGFNEIGSDALIDNISSHLAHTKWGFQETERVIYFRKKI
jgi:aminoglycoside 6'-N-acetyltransferase I